MIEKIKTGLRTPKCLISLLGFLMLAIFLFYFSYEAAHINYTSTGFYDKKDEAMKMHFITDRQEFVEFIESIEGLGNHGYGSSALDLASEYKLILKKQDEKVLLYKTGSIICFALGIIMFWYFIPDMKNNDQRKANSEAELE